MNTPPRLVNPAPPRLVNPAPPRLVNPAPPVQVKPVVQAPTPPRPIQQAPPRPIQQAPPRPIQQAPPRPIQPATTVQVKPVAPAPAPAPAPFIGLKRALLVGINYVNSQFELRGCINDVTNMTDHIKQLYPSCKEFRSLTDISEIKPSRANILSSINWLVSGLKPGEHVLFHYSGHGGLIRDVNGDELSGFDSCIYPFDGKNIEQITDDELRIQLADKIPAGCKCFVVLDCCHSGSAIDLRCRLQVPSELSLFFEELKQYPKTQGQVIFLSGCHDAQQAADTVNTANRPCGALTWALIETWKKYGTNIKLKYLLWDILVFLRQRNYPQIPQLSLGQYIDFDTTFNLNI
jgi:hypothetical protein